MKTLRDIWNEHHSYKSEIRKRGIYCISSIYTFLPNSEKICTTWFEILKYYLWTGFLMVIYPWQQTKHGQECFDNFGSTDSSLPLPLPALFLPSACWISTHVISSSNISGVHSQRPKQKGGKKTTGRRRERQVLSSSTSVQRTQCLRQHAKWILTWHMDSGSSDDIINYSPCGHNSAEPHGDKC